MTSRTRARKILIRGGEWLAWAIALVLVSAVVHSDPTVPADLPDGVIEGRSDAKYGSYTSVVRESARPYQDRLLELESKVFGLSQMVDEDPAKQSEAVYVLENEVLRLHFDVNNAPESEMTPFERQSLLFGTINAYRNLRHHAERLFENMVRFIDVKFPGPNGLQFRVESADGTESSYLPNFRSDNELSYAERRDEYKKRKTEFLGSGGSLNEIRVLTANNLSQLGEYTWTEYVQRERDRHVYFTQGKAGHVLLAGGGKVLAAGQMVIVKNPQGEITMLVLTNASGNFKPDLFSVQLLANDIVSAFKLDQEAVVLTKGEPVSTQTLRIFMKGQEVAPKEIKALAQTLEAEGRATRSAGALASRFCGKAFGGAP